MNPNSYGYSWWYKTVPIIILRDEPIVATPLHPAVDEQRRVEVVDLIAEAFKITRGGP